VRSNNGAGGVEEMDVESLLPYLIAHKEELLQSIQEGKYRPNPLRRVEIPKDNGKKRMLGIPTVVDRIIQQSVAQVLTPVFEKQFSATSYGFRPNRSAHDALMKCREYYSKRQIFVD
jgi:RNA-directed DNA polymerase